MTAHNDLDRLLAAWGDGVRLTAADAEDIRRRIVAPPQPRTTSAYRPGSSRTGSSPGQAGSLPPAGTPLGGLPPEWWRTLAGQVTEVVVQSWREPAKPGLVLVG